MKEQADTQVNAYIYNELNMELCSEFAEMQYALLNILAVTLIFIMN